MTIRIGQGFDAHAFKEGGRLVLGGVEVPHELGLEAHSDGDVAIHALCDALLGALALGDIGRHFPDSDERYRGVDSRRLLREVMAMVAERGFRVVNADLTIVAQRPRLAAYVPGMCACLADDLAVALDRVSVKATTTERMGFTGRGEGIAAMAVALLESAP